MIFTKDITDDLLQFRNKFLESSITIKSNVFNKLNLMGNFVINNSLIS